MGHLGPSFFRPQTSKVYPTRPKPPPPPHTLTPEQDQACAFFLSQGVELSKAFTARELKKAFRLLALKLHPDMNKGATEDAFIMLKKNYETLELIFS
ncbi:DnaJ domain-containing protein [Bdellovibrio sp. HCB337]|uniref:DnaJ domain-containing protein n=1 Tax=Bdellovibrio sp. HCB337 TaxID=3394358 RepID=UPI0039A50B5D